jgi:hypothetical protein
LLHRPPLHSVEQQSLPAAHASPSTLHEPPASVAHMPPVHVWEQQSELAVHAAPVLPHAVAAHLPPEHDPRQQSVFAVQLSPAAAQNVLAVQTEPLQAPPQQGVDDEHGWPAAMHMPPSPLVPPSPVCGAPQLQPTAVIITAAMLSARFMAVSLPAAYWMIGIQAHDPVAPQLPPVA